MSPIRCTQNPTMGEEWRKGWHPERIRPRESDKPVLIVGAGPAGLEAAQALGKRGYDVTLAEKGMVLGGRVTRECRLPGLSAWGRVRDYREQQLHQLPNVEIYFDSELHADSVLEFGFPRVVVATGARWRTDGVGHHWRRPVPIAEGVRVFSPDDIMDGAALPEGKRVVVWDDDHYYMGGVIAELLAEKGCETHYLTPASEASTWTRNTLEQPFIQARLLEKGVTIRSFTALDAVTEGAVSASCVFTGRTEENRGFRGGTRYLADPRGPPRSRARGARRGLGGRRDRVGDRNRRRARTRDHRPRGIRGAALRGGARRPAADRRRGPLPARARRARPPRPALTRCTARAPVRGDGRPEAVAGPYGELDSILPGRIPSGLMHDAPYNSGHPPRDPRCEPP